MIDYSALIMSLFQLLLLTLSSYGLGKIYFSNYRFNFPQSLILIYSLLHIGPIILFLLFGKPHPEVLSILLALLSFYGVFNLEKRDIIFTFNLFKKYPWTILSIFFIVFLRISTLPPDASMVRGDIGSHIYSIIQWSDGLLGYPSMTYPRGFHGLLLSVSFGADITLVSRGLLITLMTIGWSYAAAIILGMTKNDIMTAIILLIGGGGGILGTPGGLLTNSGWWLIRQSNLQPEVSAWIFVMMLLYIIFIYNKIPSNIPSKDRNILYFPLIALTIGASTTNPFFLMTSCFFIIMWWFVCRASFSKNILPKTKLELSIFFSPLAIIILSTFYIKLFFYLFNGSDIVVFEKDFFSVELEVEFGSYYTDGLTFSTIIEMISPKPSVSLNGYDQLSWSIFFILLSYPLSIIFMTAIISKDFLNKKILMVILMISALYGTWYLGIPSPIGIAAHRTHYPHYAFFIFIFIPIFNSLKLDIMDIHILISFLFVSGVNGQIMQPFINLDDDITRIICLFFMLCSYYVFKNVSPRYSFYLPTRSNLYFSFGGLLVGFWGYYNLHTFPHYEFSILLLFGLSIIIAGLLFNFKSMNIVLLLNITFYSFIGLIIAEIVDIFQGYHLHDTLYISVPIIFSFLIINILQYSEKNKFRIRPLEIFTVFIMLNYLFFIINPAYLSPLMGSSIPAIP